MADPHFKDVYLQLYVARLFEIAGAVTRIGAITDTSTCHADALTAPQAERFQDNLNNVNSDGENAGLPTDFALIDRIDTIGSALTTAVNAQGGDLLMGIEAFFKASFPGQC